MSADRRPGETRCVAAFSQHPDASAAVGEVVGTVLELANPHPDLAVVLVSGSLDDRFESIVAAIRSLLAPETLIGATAPAVFGGPHDLLGDRGLMLLAFHGTEATSLRLTVDRSGTPTGLPADIAPGSTLLLFGERSFPVDRLSAELCAADHDVNLVGALAAGRPGGRTSTMAEHDRFHTDGAVGVLIPARSAQVFGFEARIWEEHDPLPEPPVNPARGSGALLLVNRNVDLVGSRSLDLEVLLERFSGALAGVVGRAFRSAGDGVELGRDDQVVTLILG